MNCKYIKPLIPLFLDAQLSRAKTHDVETHLKVCESCRKELLLQNQAWNLLKEWKPLAARPDYIPAFWSRLTERTPWYGAIAVFIQERFLTFKFAGALSIAVIIGVLVFNNMNQWGIPSLDTVELDPESIEMMSNLELVSDLDILEEYEFFRDFDVIDNVEFMES